MKYPGEKNSQKIEKWKLRFFRENPKNKQIDRKVWKDKSEKWKLRNFREKRKNKQIHQKLKKEKWKLRIFREKIKHINQKKVLDF